MCAFHLISIVGPVFVAIAITMKTSIAYIFLFSIIPYYTNFFTFFGISQSCFFLFAFVNTFFNFIMTIFTSPGEPPYVEFGEELIDQLRKDCTSKPGERFSRYCRICSKPKPPHCHHCHLCNKCILNMDHHCPWVNNCIGYNNHRYFILYLIYIFIGSCQVAILSYLPFEKAIDFDEDWMTSSYSRGGIIYEFVICAAVSMGMFFFLFWNLFLVATAQTTIEFHHYSLFPHGERPIEAKNEFDKGLKENVLSFFVHKRHSETKWWWSLIRAITVPQISSPPAFPLDWSSLNFQIPIKK
eukprot:TRINITY_DN3442_c0_g1_i3.p1 TRINITY_DN3442_c0_g1~~TRINITY_DN3442_c0_g1_i3.p1  ORF type:complete len:298 (-),score=28.25 TRINITY_DN3442_c0_g1_i3:93-986(-)